MRRTGPLTSGPVRFRGGAARVAPLRRPQHAASRRGAMPRAGGGLNWRSEPAPANHRAGVFEPPMSLKINELCVNCDVCEPACPNQAIAQGETIYVIDPARCTECVGHYDEPQCVVVCPVECIDKDPEFVETQTQLLDKLRRLQQE